MDSENVTVIVSTYDGDDGEAASKSPAGFDLNVEMVDNFVASDGAWSANETISRGDSHIWIFKPKIG